MPPPLQFPEYIPGSCPKNVVPACPNTCSLTSRWTRHPPLHTPSTSSLTAPRSRISRTSSLGLRRPWIVQGPGCRTRWRTGASRLMAAAPRPSALRGSNFLPFCLPTILVCLAPWTRRGLARNGSLPCPSFPLIFPFPCALICVSLRTFCPAGLDHVLPLPGRERRRRRPSLPRILLQRC